MISKDVNMGKDGCWAGSSSSSKTLESQCRCLTDGHTTWPQAEVVSVLD